MSWSYDAGHPDPDARWREWDDEAPPEPARAVWPGEPRHLVRTDPAGEAARIAADLTAGLAALVRDALARLDDLDHQPGDAPEDSTTKERYP